MIRHMTRLLISYEQSVLGPHLLFDLYVEYLELLLFFLLQIIKNTDLGNCDQL